MKMKMLGLGILSVVGLTLSTASVSAFSLLPNCLCKHHCANRPYNAFSPAPNCCGNCCHGGGVPGPIFANLPPMCGDMGCYASAPMMDMGSAPMMSAPAAQPPMPNVPNFTPPAPTPSPVFNQTSMQWAPQSMGVQPIGYNQGYYPAYPTNAYPVNNYPTAPAMPVPYYWYNSR